MVRRVRVKRVATKTRGQSLVEFAIVSIFLFTIILGIIEAGRFLFVFSVVSNAAQEGSRYGMVRPRDLYTSSEAARRIALGTPLATQVVVPDGSCNVIDKTREKVWGIPSSDMQVDVWFDDGSGTPTVVPTAYDDVLFVTAPAGINRIVVETTYVYRFIVPLFDRFAPDGLTIKMRSARTILRPGDEPVPCAINFTPAPTRTPAPTNTPTPSNTPTNTPTLTPTQTPSNTPVPPTATATATNTKTPTITNTALPPTATGSPTSTAVGTATPTSKIIFQPTATPTMMRPAAVEGRGIGAADGTGRSPLWSSQGVEPRSGWLAMPALVPSRAEEAVRCASAPSRSDSGGRRQDRSTPTSIGECAIPPPEQMSTKTSDRGGRLAGAGADSQSWRNKYET